MSRALPGVSNVPAEAGLAGSLISTILNPPSPLEANAWSPDKAMAVTLPGVPKVATSLGFLGSEILTTLRRSEEHTSELQSRLHLVCRLLLEKKKGDCGGLRVFLFSDSGCVE